MSFTKKLLFSSSGLLFATQEMWTQSCSFKKKQQTSVFIQNLQIFEPWRSIKIYLWPPWPNLPSLALDLLHLPWMLKFCSWPSFSPALYLAFSNLIYFSDFSPRLHGDDPRSLSPGPRDGSIFPRAYYTPSPGDNTNIACWAHCLPSSFSISVSTYGATIRSVV